MTAVEYKTVKAPQAKSSCPGDGSPTCEKNFAHLMFPSSPMRVNAAYLRCAK